MSKKKETIKKEVKVAKPKQVKQTTKDLPITPSTCLLSFTVSAVIPVMSYGNIQPSITVNARTIEDAQEYALPVIEKLFEKYVESPRDGSPKPSFIPKSNVTVKETVVAPTHAPKEKTPTPVAPSSPSMTETEALVEKSAPFTKAENAIKAALSLDVLNMIEDQVQKSTKLTEEEKYILIPMILYKRKEI